MRAFVLVGVALSLAESSYGTTSVAQFGDADVLGTGIYPGDPTAGATLSGLAPGAVTFGAPALGHSFPFDPSGDYPGTDQIYVGAAQSASHDGYSSYAGRILGPQVIVIDYDALAPAGESITTFSLGIAFDDFQQVPLGQPFILSINGVVNQPLTDLANSLDQTTPQVQFASIGIDPALLLGTNILTLTIDQGGDGGDGWAIDFLTVGVETAIPAPSSAALMFVGAGLATRRRR